MPDVGLRGARALPRAYQEHSRALSTDSSSPVYVARWIVHPILACHAVARSTSLLRLCRFCPERRRRGVCRLCHRRGRCTRPTRCHRLRCIRLLAIDIRRDRNLSRALQCQQCPWLGPHSVSVRPMPELMRELLKVPSPVAGEKRLEPPALSLATKMADRSGCESNHRPEFHSPTVECWCEPHWHLLRLERELAV